jgi:hypothetical protein
MAPVPPVVTENGASSASIGPLNSFIGEKSSAVEVRRPRIPSADAGCCAQSAVSAAARACPGAPSSCMHHVSSPTALTSVQNAAILPVMISLRPGRRRTSIKFFRNVYFQYVHWA